MHDDPKANAPLLRAIAELRDHVDRLIDEQIALLSRYEGESVPGEMPFAPTDPVATPAVSAPAEPIPSDKADDPTQRLDALAKHLDRKLRKAQG